jgi:hypothetical protein
MLLVEMETFLTLQQVAYTDIIVLYKVKNLVPEEAGRFKKATVQKLFL